MINNKHTGANSGSREPSQSTLSRPVGFDPERELGLLYNYAADDSRQFTRWQMFVAIVHGYRLAEARNGETA